MAETLDTEPYKGTRDFYPRDMAVQRYIFGTWAKTAELFGFERYDASVLEPAELYKSKGAENEELVNDQTYTFTDRGEREVTLRPEMTPTVARMVAGKRRELSFPVRWYSIPNLFRYERPQRGRLREHWQLNCDMFGVSDISADIEMISLAYHTLTAFGATPDMFEIRINHRQLRSDWLKEQYGIDDPNILSQVSRILDKKNKIIEAELKGLLEPIVQENYEKFRKELDLGIDEFVQLLNSERTNLAVIKIVQGLKNLGITNIVFDASLSRGFDYYTGTIFEIFDTSTENNRALLGGGRYDNLTELFGGDPIAGIGFGMGDVTVRDFLETHDLLPKDIHVTAPTLAILPTDPEFNMEGEKVAQEFRNAGISTSVDLSDKKLGKKIGNASEAGVAFILVVGEDEAESQTFTLKNLKTTEEKTGSIQDLIANI
jgi:histidyl-tRNA synthetase